MKKETGYFLGQENLFVDELKHFDKMKKVPNRNALVLTSGTRCAYDVSVQQFHAGSIIGTRTRLTIVRCSPQRVAVESTRASFAVGAFRVVLADTTTGIHVAGGRVPVAVARDASSQRSAVRWIATISGLAALAELADVSGRARALFHPRRRIVQVAGTRRRFQDDVVQDADAVGGVRGANADGSHVGQDLLEDDRFHPR